MITIFHGDDQVKSREAFLSSNSAKLKLDSKNIKLDQINNYLNEGSLFSDTKAISISNYFSIPKANLDKLSKLMIKTKCDVYLWQDKLLNATQLKTFPQAKINLFKASNDLYTCLIAFKPKKFKKFITLYEKVVEQNLFDLFLYMLKGNLRKLLQSKNLFNEKQLLQTYLRLIELEFQYKNGQLTLPKEIALKRVVLSILS